MTLTRRTLEIALVEVNRRRAHHRRAVDRIKAAAAKRLIARNPGSTTGAISGHERELERLNTAHAELAAELELVKATAR